MKRRWLAEGECELGAVMAVFNSLSTFISKVQAQAHSYSPWKNNSMKLKTLVQASLLATSPTNDRPAGRSALCPNSQLSCHNTTAMDTCCLNYPGGLMLQTQFWDSDPPVGPSDSWTIHGLWSVISFMTIAAGNDLMCAQA